MIKDSVLSADLKDIAGQDFSELRNRSVLITGATGLIGMHLVFALDELNNSCGYNTHIIIMARSRDKAAAVFADIIEHENVEVVISEITDKISFDGEIDYIIHAASATASKYFVSNPVETIDIAINGTRNILELAREKKVKGFLYLSSLEVYGVPVNNGIVNEKDYGYIDPLSARSSYSEGKRMTECLVYSYGEEYKVPVKIARLSQTFGTGVEYNDGRVFAEFIRSVFEKKDIVLHTLGNTVRTYLYTKDAVTGIFTVLLKGKNQEAYNITNKDTAISIKDMAELVADTFPEAGINVKIDIPEDSSSYGYNPEMVIKLGTDKLEALGWKAEVALRDMFKFMKVSIEERR